VRDTLFIQPTEGMVAYLIYWITSWDGWCQGLS